MPTELHVYDFDGTLFRSPERPEWWPTPGWWGRPESLNPPCVPEHPGPEYWVAPVVAAAKKSISDPDVYAVLATGRLVARFHKRVPQLLAQAGLRFDETHLTTGGGTLPFKVGLIGQLVATYPEITTVRMWEDRAEHAGPFKTAVESFGKTFHIHLVNVDSMPVACPAPTPAEKIAARFQAKT